jgi:hypothetical protein
MTRLIRDDERLRHRPISASPCQQESAAPTTMSSNSVFMGPLKSKSGAE